MGLISGVILNVLILIAIIVFQSKNRQFNKVLVKKKLENLFLWVHSVLKRPEIFGINKKIT